jgi:hypothetical protein
MHMAEQQSRSEQDSDGAASRAGRPHEDIATAAYFIAERRGFQGDRQVEDWLEAERALGVNPADGAARDELAARAHVEEDIKADEVHQWADKLGVPVDRLRVAIQRAGPSSEKVREFLANEDSGEKPATTSRRRTLGKANGAKRR